MILFDLNIWLLVIFIPGKFIKFLWWALSGYKVRFLDTEIMLFPTEKSVQINLIEFIEKAASLIRAGLNVQKKYKFSTVPLEAIYFAMEQLNVYIDFRDNNDIDKAEEPVDANVDEKWTKLYEWFYAACQ